jgi:hypothetical protein
VLTQKYLQASLCAWRFLLTAGFRQDRIGSGYPQRLEKFARCGRFSENVLKREAEFWKQSRHPDFSCTIQDPRVSPDGRTSGLTNERSIFRKPFGDEQETEEANALKIERTEG